MRTEWFPPDPRRVNRLAQSWVAGMAEVWVETSRADGEFAVRCFEALAPPRRQRATSQPSGDEFGDAIYDLAGAVGHAGSACFRVLAAGWSRALDSYFRRDCPPPSRL